MFISKLSMASTMFFVFTLSGYGTERVADCPVANVKNNVFDASVLKKNSNFYRKRHRRISVGS